MIIPEMPYQNCFYRKDRIYIFELIILETNFIKKLHKCKFTNF